MVMSTEAEGVGMILILLYQTKKQGDIWKISNPIVSLPWGVLAKRFERQRLIRMQAPEIKVFL